jgi:hypothetical protein
MPSDFPPAANLSTIAERAAWRAFRIHICVKSNTPVLASIALTAARRRPNLATGSQ